MHTEITLDNGDGRNKQTKKLLEEGSTAKKKKSLIKQIGT